MLTLEALINVSGMQYTRKIALPRFTYLRRTAIRDLFSKCRPISLGLRADAECRVFTRKDVYVMAPEIGTRRSQSSISTSFFRNLDYVDILRRLVLRTRCCFYDTIRWTILTCAQKLTSSQLNLPHGTEQKRIMKKLKQKNGDAQKKRSGREVRGVSPEAGRESMVGKICERGRS